MPISADYDREADALYVRLAGGDRDHTVEISDTTYVDVDQQGHALGVELLYPSLGLDLNAVAERFELRSLLPEIIAAIAAAGAPLNEKTLTLGHHLASTITVITSFEGTVAAAGAALPESVSKGSAEPPLVGCAA